MISTQNLLTYKPNILNHFLEYYYYSLEYKDVDCNLFVLQNIFERLELNIEQRYWLCWLYANTYNLPTAWIIWNEFPDMELVDINRLEKWQDENLKYIKYQKDCKWSRSYLPKMFQSYKENIGEESQYTFFSTLNNFDQAYEKICKSFYKFGRYTCWFYLQSLNYLMCKPYHPNDLLLGKGSTYMQITALSLILRDSSEYLNKIDRKQHFLVYKDQYDSLVNYLEHLVREKQPSVPPGKYFTETVLCAFSKLFRPNKSRYIGYYIDRQYQDIIFYQEQNRFTGINWDLLHQAREEEFDNRFLSNEGVSKEKSQLFYNNRVIKWWENYEDRTNY